MGHQRQRRRDHPMRQQAGPEQDLGAYGDDGDRDHGPEQEGLDAAMGRETGASSPQGKAPEVARNEGGKGEAGRAPVLGQQAEAARQQPKGRADLAPEPTSPIPSKEALRRDGARLVDLRASSGPDQGTSSCLAPQWYAHRPWATSPDGRRRRPPTPPPRLVSRRLQPRSRASRARIPRPAWTFMTSSVQCAALRGHHAPHPHRCVRLPVLARLICAAAG